MSPQKQYPKPLLCADFRYAGRPDWQRRIIEEYPEIYRVPGQSGTGDQTQEPVAEDYCNLRSGFECGPGWQTLIERLSCIAHELVTKLKDSGLQCDAWIKPLVIKQKLGELRWQGHSHLGSPFDKLWLAYIDQIRRESRQTCELSGEIGQIRSVGRFIICLSDKEYRKWKRSPQKQGARYRLLAA